MRTLLAIPCYNEAGRLPSYLPALLERIASSGLLRIRRRRRDWNAS